jgi:hypothetical protein
VAQLIITEAPDFVARPDSAYDDRWGVAQLVDDAYVITRHLHQKAGPDSKWTETNAKGAGWVPTGRFGRPALV